MKFTSALVLGIVAASTSIKMKAERTRNEKGGLLDVLRNPDFKLDNDNQSYLFMDITSYHGTDNEEKRQLKKKVDYIQKLLI